MRNDIGTPVRSTLWDPADEITTSALQSFIRSQLTRWEPRINVLGVTSEIEEDPVTNAVRIVVFIEYEIKSTRRLGSVTTSAIVSRRNF